ncbi:hypothetical protein, partial [Methylocystis sp.]|uniref:hypothetical protein n=1 Tax=Methylocystis sp. TaxID=1911079 RepID=UPI003DA44289
VEPQILNSTVHHSGVFSIQMYTRKSAAFRNALKFNRPISQFLMCPDTGNEARVGRKLLVGADIDENRPVGETDQTGELIGRDQGVSRHAASSAREAGRDAWACRVKGRPQSPQIN